MHWVHIELDQHQSRFHTTMLRVSSRNPSRPDPNSAQSGIPLSAPFTHQSRLPIIPKLLQFLTKGFFFSVSSVDTSTAQLPASPWWSEQLPPLIRTKGRLLSQNCFHRSAARASIDATEYDHSSFRALLVTHCSSLQDTLPFLHLWL